MSFPSATPASALNALSFKAIRFLAVPLQPKPLCLMFATACAFIY
jgi:hypothetical protein